MIRFSQRLKTVLAAVRKNQKEFAEEAGVSATNISRWLRGTALPDKKSLGKMLPLLPLEHASKLVAAWLYDSLPPSADRMVNILPNNQSAKFEEVPDEWPPGVDRTIRKKFTDFCRLATDHPDVMEIVNILHTAAMRAASQDANR